MNSHVTPWLFLPLPYSEKFNFRYQDCFFIVIKPSRKQVFPRSSLSFKKKKPMTPVCSRCCVAEVHVTHWWGHSTHSLSYQESLSFPRKKEKKKFQVTVFILRVLCPREWLDRQEEALLPSRWKSAIAELLQSDSCRKPNSWERLFAPQTVQKDRIQFD